MELVKNYFPELDEKKFTKLKRLAELVEEWNEKINVISRKDVENLEERHILHSLGIARVIQFIPQTHVLDVGTGGGFPGLPLAVLFPETQFLLIDSIGKKIKVVEDIAKDLNLKNVRVKQQRAENLEERFDFVMARAVMRLDKFLAFTRKNVHKLSLNSLPNGILYLKGGDLQGDLGAEIKEIPNRVKPYPLSEFFREEYFETKYVLHVPV